jgi:cold shock CspA family protein
MSSEQDTSSAPESSPVIARLLGQVKWFNNKAGYGFITVNDGEYSGKDIFIHYSAIQVTNSQYKYLVQGEYVEFNLVKSTTGSHEYQAVDIAGIKGGALMCETRRNNRPPPRAPVSGDSSESPRGPPRRSVNRVDRDSKPQAVDGEFTSVRRKSRPQGTRPPRVQK